MKKEKFLTVYAVFNQEVEEKLNLLQNEILKKYPAGTQTMGIPFHISLGSFPIEMEKELISRIEDVVKLVEPFSIEIDGFGSFNNQVIFAKPILNEGLIALHNQFEGNYADGFPWHPHITLYCGKEEEGKEILKSLPKLHLNAKIIGLELGEFFPTRIILNKKLK